MKKIILISMITSGMLLASSVTDLTTNVENEILNGVAPVINNSNVSQGHTVVSGDSTINNVQITQIKNSISETGIDSATVNQGLTQVNNGTLTKSTLDSTSDIKDSSITSESVVRQASTVVSNGTIQNVGLSSTNTIVEASVTGSSTLDQGVTIVNDGAELEDTKVTSTNGLAGIVENSSNVSQATVELNGQGSSLDGDSILTTTNTIIANIDKSEVHQARVRVGGGYKVSTLIMKETNNLIANVTGGSSVKQGGVDACAQDGGLDASDWCED